MLGKGVREIEGLSCEGLLYHGKMLAFTVNGVGGHCRGLLSSYLHFKMIMLDAVLRIDHRGWQN